MFNLYRIYSNGTKQTLIIIVFFQKVIQPTFLLFVDVWSEIWGTSYCTCNSLSSAFALAHDALLCDTYFA